LNADGYLFGPADPEAHAAEVEHLRGTSPAVLYGNATPCEGGLLAIGELHAVSVCWAVAMTTGRSSDQPIGECPLRIDGGRYIDGRPILPYVQRVLDRLIAAGQVPSSTTLQVQPSDQPSATTLSLANVLALASSSNAQASKTSPVNSIGKPIGTDVTPGGLSIGSGTTLP
jgi:hypothetical protein